jgi:hypothetical protein
MVECPVTNRPEITIAPYLLGSALHRLLVSVTIKALPHNLPPRYNICPTDPVDAVIGTRRQSRLRPHAVETRAVVVAETPSRN